MKRDDNDLDGNGVGDYPGWELGTANSISDTGYITGWGSHNGEDRAFLLIPNTL